MFGWRNGNCLLDGNGWIDGWIEKKKDRHHTVQQKILMSMDGWMERKDITFFNKEIAKEDKSKRWLVNK